MDSSRARWRFGKLAAVAAFSPQRIPAHVTLRRATEDRTPPEQQTARLTLTIPGPRETRSVRVVVETEKDGRDCWGRHWIAKPLMRRLKRQRPNAQLLHRPANETPPTPAKP
jgi:hypothetical protein